MMMNQGGVTDTITTLDPNSLENRQAVDPSQAYTSSYYASSTGSTASPWTMPRTDNCSTDSGVFSNSNYHHYQAADPSARNAQDGLSVASIPSTSVSGPANVQQDSGSYATYPNTDPYGYGNTGYTGYYSGYQQQSKQSYPQPVGAYQSTGAPYQSFSSFQNTGPYGGPPSYSSTYYNSADYQTSGGGTNGGYSNQTNLWHEGNYASYSSPQFPSYTPDSNGAYSSSSMAATSQQYQQHYNQWADYYSQTEVTCAPGTEKSSLTSTSNHAFPAPGVTGGYLASNSLPPAPFTSSWRQEPALPSVKAGPVSSSVLDGHWKHGSPGLQSHYVTPQPNFQKPADANSVYGTLQDQLKSAGPQGPNTLYPAIQVPQTYQSSMQSVSQTFPSSDSCRVSKLQIPTNPRIASTLALGLQKSDQDSSTTRAAAKPAYISVPLPKPNEKVPSHDSVDSILKPGMFPKSLRGYVERALARCKDDTQKAACQSALKEVITKATADGTLHTRDWDIEPLFPLPTADAANNESFLFSTLGSSSQKKTNRPFKSRWEPMLEEKPVEKPTPVTFDTSKYFGWAKANDRDKKFSGGKTVVKNGNLSSTKFSLSDQKTTNRNVPRLTKRQRLADSQNAVENENVSSDSDKEQSLAAYSADAIALADSPEEKKKRENRSKRFEKRHGNRSENNNFRPKSVGAGNLYTRRTRALLLSKTFEDSGNRAVEDMDWDSLTVRGTCKEIEKRYLRLTSAPDPATVRPEEVLEKALVMVQDSQKNYLYKCDQLKSIRQDLTVQRIRNELTVKVYETHARLAIEFGDLAEYNQCQSQLQTLYAEGIKGCHMEFSAYNLLCVILHSKSKRDLLSAMSRLTVEARKDESVKHALAVRAAVNSENYILFFRLYKTAPNLHTCLMDLYVEKMRYAAVKCMCRSYRPAVPIAYIAQVLGFTTVLPANEVSDEKDVEGFDECVEWLKAHGACLMTENSGELMLDTKASVSSLFMPEPEDAVAHGDANLAVDDFFTRT